MDDHVDLVSMITELHQKADENVVLTTEVSSLRHKLEKVIERFSPGPTWISQKDDELRALQEHFDDLKSQQHTIIETITESLRVFLIIGNALSSHVLGISVCSRKDQIVGRSIT